MSRLLIVGGGCRGQRLAADLIADAHAVRITTRSSRTCAAIEATGAQCWVGTPDRLATLRSALDSVTIACWLLRTARGPDEQLRELHSSRLRSFLASALDTPMRGFVYEPAPQLATPDPVPDVEHAMPDAMPDAIDARSGEALVRAFGERHALPVAFLRDDPRDLSAWLAGAKRAVSSLL